MHPATMHPARPKPLSHVRVLDLSRLLPGRLRFGQAWNGTPGESSLGKWVGTVIGSPEIDFVEGVNGQYR